MLTYNRLTSCWKIKHRENMLSIKLVPVKENQEQYANKAITKWTKLSPKDEQYIMIGYASRYKPHQLLNQITKKVMISRNVRFIENGSDHFTDQGEELEGENNEDENKSSSKPSQIMIDESSNEFKECRQDQSNLDDGSDTNHDNINDNNDLMELSSINSIPEQKAVTEPATRQRNLWQQDRFTVDYNAEYQFDKFTDELIREHSSIVNKIATEKLLRESEKIIFSSILNESPHSERAVRQWIKSNYKKGWCW